MTKRFKHAVLGGTFDHLHRGHQAIIDLAFTEANHVSIGLTAKKLTNGKLLASAIQSFSERKVGITRYLKKKGYSNRATIVLLKDIYGPTLTDKSIDSIISTVETKKNVEKINDLRKKMHLPKLKMISAPLVVGNDNQIISSSRIRSGTMNRQGLAYSSLFKYDLLMPSPLKVLLRKPLTNPVFYKNELDTAKKVGTYIRRQKPPLFITVGDIVSTTFIKSGFTPDLAIVDIRTQREDILDSPFHSKKKYLNLPGTINRDTVIKIQREIEASVQNSDLKTIVIDGEEDLLTLPAILFAPLHSYVLYGQPKDGIVAVRVTEQMKKIVERLLQNFHLSK